MAILIVQNARSLLIAVPNPFDQHLNRISPGNWAVGGGRGFVCYGNFTMLYKKMEIWEYGKSLYTKKQEGGRNREKINGAKVHGYAMVKRKRKDFG